MKLFSHVLIRVSGGPFAKLEQLRLCRSTQIAEELQALKAQIGSLKHALSDALYDVVGAQTDATIRVTLINLRRDIFNERKITGQDFELINPHLPKEVGEDVKTYMALREKTARLWREGEAVYARELVEVRHQFRDLVEADNLQKGLVLSSQSLLTYGIPGYLNSDLASLSKQERKTEQSLIKYISRIYAKTSPFSTFTNLAIGELNGEAETERLHSVFRHAGNGKPQVVSHIRLNNYLYKYLQGLLTKNPAVYRRLALRPNPTLTKENDHYLYLTNSNNVESFQRIPFNPVVELFQILTSAKREGVVYQDVVQTIIDNEYIDAPGAEIEAYINQLIEYGFLEFNIGVSGIDPDWDLKLCQKLAPLCQALPLIDELLETLARIRDLAGQYGKANVARRQEILQEAFEQWRAICMDLHEAAGLPEEERLPPEEQKATQGEQQEEDEPETVEDQEDVFKHQTATRFHFRPEQLFYEDTALDASIPLPADGIIGLTSSLCALFPELAQFEGRREEQMKMHHYFVQKYGADGTINLLRFYEEYYREVKKPEAERAIQRQQMAAAKEEHPGEEESEDDKNEQERRTGEPDGESEDDPLVPELQERQKQKQAWMDHFAETVREQGLNGRGQMELNLAQVKQTNKALPLKNGHRGNNSYGVFMQLFIESDESGAPRLMGVLNSSFPGYGKMMSRFLHLFADEITEDIRCWNRSLSQNTLFVENSDASYFNANLHPPLMPYEVWIPGGHNSLPAQQQVAVTELQVSLEQTTGNLRLTHQPSQKRAYVFDMGFQGHGGRSQLFQLLDRFTNAKYLSPYPLQTAVAKLWYLPETAEQEKEKTIQIRPRIVYERQLVLQRKAWLVPRERLPFREGEESDWDYFARVNAWRLEWEIPEEVFVYLFDRRAIQNLEPEARRKLGRDDYKPQYICFQDPFLVTLFEKLVDKVPVRLTLEEMLPDSRQLLPVGGRRHVTEFVIQWYEREEAQH